MHIDEAFPPILDGHLVNVPVLYPVEFDVSNEPHDRCHFDTVLFWDHADDLMSTEQFKENFDGFFAIYVMKACSKCGGIEWYDYDNNVPMLYVKLIRETPENCSRYHYHNNDDYDSSDYEWVGE